jgi:hypothetical protein
VVEWLRKGGAVDALGSSTTADGRTTTRGLLHAAAANDRLEMVRELLKRGASVDLPTSFGSTALMNAAGYSHLSIVLVLLQHSANPDLQNNYGVSALMAAAGEGHEACVQALLRAKANTELGAARHNKTAAEQAGNIKPKLRTVLSLCMSIVTEPCSLSGTAFIRLYRYQLSPVERNDTPPLSVVCSVLFTVPPRGVL